MVQIDTQHYRHKAMPVKDFCYMYMNQLDSVLRCCCQMSFNINLQQFSFFFFTSVICSGSMLLFIHLSFYQIYFYINDRQQQVQRFILVVYITVTLKLLSCYKEDRMTFDALVLEFFLSECSRVKSLLNLVIDPVNRSSQQQ